MSIDHRAEAEKHLATAARHLTEVSADMRIAEVSAWIGHGHAALARNEEQAATTADLRDAITLLRRRNHAMRELIATHIVDALASKDAGRAKAALHLARDLDEADANVDDLLNERMPADGWAPNWATSPTDDPWAADPKADALDAMRRIVAGHLAEMFLDGENEAVRKWARGIADELRRADVDIHDAIVRRIRDLTLGPDLSEPPF